MEERDFLAAGRDVLDATQSERVSKSPMFSVSAGSRHVSVCGGVRLEAVPGRLEGSIRIVGGPLVITVSPGARGPAHAFLSFLNAFYIKDGVFLVDGTHRVYFEIETSDPMKEDGGIEGAAETVSSSVGRLVPLIEAVCTGRLSSEEAVGHLASLRPSISRAELDELMESLGSRNRKKEETRRRSLLDEVRKAERREIVEVMESEGGDVEGVVNIRERFRPLRIKSFAGGSRAKVHLTLLPGLVGTEGAPDFALRVAELAAKDEGWRHVAVDPRDGECVLVVQVLTDLLGPSVSKALEWALVHGGECSDLAWSVGRVEDAKEGARRRIVELLGGAPKASVSTE